MFYTWKRFSQWICDIQIRMYFANLQISICYIILNYMKSAVDVLGLWMISWFLSQCYGASVVAQYLQWVPGTWNHTKLSDEVPDPNSFTWRFCSSHVFRFYCRSRDHALLEASLAHSSSIQNINVSCLRFIIIRVGVETSVDVTFYDELLITSIHDRTYRRGIWHFAHSISIIYRS